MKNNRIAIYTIKLLVQLCYVRLAASAARGLVVKVTQLSTSVKKATAQTLVTSQS